MEELSERDAAQGRCLAYGLLADLLARGITDATREAAEASEPIARALADREPDEVAADHEHAFGWCAPPFAGAYLAEDRVSGGAVERELRALFESGGFAVDPRGEGAEHLATGLRYLAFLSGAQADAIEDGEKTIAAHVRERLAEALVRVLAWAPPWADAVRRAERAWPSALVDQIEALLFTHHAALGAPAVQVELPAPELALDDPDTNLMQLAELLATPARCGAVLSRVDIQRLGRGARIPRGFGDRPLLIKNLLAASGRFDATDPVIAALDEELSRQSDALAEAPRGAVTAPWQARIAHTRGLLTEIRGRVRQLED